MNLNYKNVDHISFDLWLTLIKSNPEFKKQRNQLFKDFFRIENSIEEVSQKIRYFDVLCNKINENTGLNIDTFEIYYLILSSLEVDITKINTAVLEDFYLKTEELFLEYKPQLLFENIKDIFKEIKNNGKTMNILSNTAFIKGKTLRKIVKHYEIEDYFLFQIYSDECEYSKPNEKIFNLVYQEVNKYKKIEKFKILHVGDNRIADFDGAKKFGFDAYLIQ